MILVEDIAIGVTLGIMASELIMVVVIAGLRLLSAAYRAIRTAL